MASLHLAIFIQIEPGDIVRSLHLAIGAGHV
jgi:hypothetical protein